MNEKEFRDYCKQLTPEQLTDLAWGLLQNEQDLVKIIREREGLNRDMAR